MEGRRSKPHERRVDAPGRRLRSATRSRLSPYGTSRPSSHSDASSYPVAASACRMVEPSVTSTDSPSTITRIGASQSLGDAVSRPSVAGATRTRSSVVRPYGSGAETRRRTRARYQDRGRIRDSHPAARRRQHCRDRARVGPGAGDPAAPVSASGRCEPVRGVLAGCGHTSRTPTKPYTAERRRHMSSQAQIPRPGRCARHSTGDRGPRVAAA